MISHTLEKIHFLSGDQRIDGTLFTPTLRREKFPAVIFLHGLTSSEKRYIDFAEALSSLGFITLTINMRGHGTSDGSPDILRIKDAQQDGIAAYDYIFQNEQVDQSRIGICGSSFGAAVASLVSVTRKIKSLVLRVPATYSDAMMDMSYSQIMTDENNIFNTLSNPKDTPAVEAISLFRGDLLIVVSGQDAIIPRQIPQQYFDSAMKVSSKEFTVIEGATHPLSNEKHKKQFEIMMQNWFQKTL